MIHQATEPRVDDDLEDDAGKEIWATYSVKDHLYPRALALDVLLFDRLVFPVPEVWRIDGDPTAFGGVEWTPDPDAVAHWKPEWQLDEQSEILEILKPVARKVSWGPKNVERESYQLECARLAKQGVPDYAFSATRTEMTRDLAEFVKGVAVLGPAFRSFGAADAEFGFTNDRGRRVLPGEYLPVLLTWELLLPNFNRPGLAPKQALREAVALINGNTDYRTSRDAFVDWQKRFVRNGVTSKEAFDKATETMRGLVADLERETKRLRLGEVTTRLCQFLPIAVPVAIAGAAGQYDLAATTALAGWAAGHAIESWLFGKRSEGSPAPAAFVFDAENEFLNLRR